MGAPVGNQYYQFGLDNTGRPKQYETPEQLQAKIDEYYNDCEINELPLTTEGLAYFLDVDRVTLLRYEKSESHKDFSHTIIKAKNKILKYKMENAIMGKSNTAIAIFDLKNNYNYKDKQETEFSGKIEGIKIYLPDNGRNKTD